MSWAQLWCSASGAAAEWESAYLFLKKDRKPQRLAATFGDV